MMAMASEGIPAWVRIISIIAVSTVFCGIGYSLDPLELQKVFNTSLSTPRSPGRVVLLGVLAFSVIMPAVGVCLARWMSLSPETQIGMVLLSIMPGGANAAVYSQVAGGMPAINGLTTIISSVLSVVMVPLLCYVVIQPLVDSKTIYVSPVELFLTSVLVASAIFGGALLRYFVPTSSADTVKQILRWVYIPLFFVYMLALTAPAISPKRAFGGMALAACGYIVGIALCLSISASRQQLISLALELSVHDMPLAIAIISNSFKGDDLFLKGSLDMVLCASFVAHFIAFLVASGLKLADHLGIVDISNGSGTFDTIKDTLSYGAAET